MKRFLIPLTTGFVFLICWEVFVWYQINIQSNELFSYILPAPSMIIKTLYIDFNLMIKSLWVTLRITLISLFFAVFFGVLMAILFSSSKWVEYSLSPYTVILQVTPLVAIAPLIIIWSNRLDPNGWLMIIFDQFFGVSRVDLSLIACAWIVSFFPIMSNTLIGLKSYDRNLYDLLKLTKANPYQMLLKLKLPTALPFFLGGLKISGGLALIGAVVAEFVAGTSGQHTGLASRILEASYNLRIDRMFAALILISLMGVIIYQSIQLLSYFLLRHWHESFLQKTRE